MRTYIALAGAATMCVLLVATSLSFVANALCGVKGDGLYEPLMK